MRRGEFEDLSGCRHTMAALPHIQRGQIVYWTCLCGHRVEPETTPLPASASEQLEPSE